MADDERETLAGKEPISITTPGKTGLMVGPLKENVLVCFVSEEEEVSLIVESVILLSTSLLVVLTVVRDCDCCLVGDAKAASEADRNNSTFAANASRSVEVCSFEGDSACLVGDVD